MPPSETTETIAGCRVRIRRKGSGTPLLFLHGTTGAEWLPVHDRLAERHAVILPDHPGYGASDTPDWLDSISDMAYFYLDLLEHLGLTGRVHVVGTSIGGWIAAEMAVRDPDAMCSLTLAAAAGINVKGARRGDLFMWSPEESLRQMLHDPGAAGLPGPSGDDPETVMKNRAATARLGWNPRLHNPDLPKWLHRVKVPTLVLWGDDDRLLPGAHGTAWARMIPGARLEVIAACGHLLHVEKPAEVAEATLGFIAAAA